ncbi:MAG: polyhydroxyalkanoate synthesis repressor PhaR [Azospirillaceae bacterium]|nr:polyhydroxyalkanoate synthesis repressor PhaR [Azospirillaceae bacterium]
MAEKDDNKSTPITIKKYANRRLYNTASSSYVTLDHLCKMVKDGVDFAVYDAKTGEEITRSVLTQIIVEEENKGQNLLPIGFLRQLIGFYGDNMGWLVPRYLEYSMQSLSHNQEQVKDYFQNTLGGIFPFGTLEEMGKQNLAMLERAMRMFSPFGAPERPPAEPPAAQTTSSASHRPDVENIISELNRQIDELHHQLAALNKTKP